LREGEETQGGRKYIEENTVEKYQMFPKKGTHWEMIRLSIKSKNSKRKNCELSFVLINRAFLF
jgi:hypothetical protein